MSAGSVDVLDIAVGIGVVVAGALALVGHRRMANVVAYLVFGVLLSALWAVLGAPDVALAEAALGTGITSALLVDTVTRSARPPDPDRTRPALAPALALVALTVALAAGLAAALLRAVVPLGGATTGLAGPVGRVLPATGVGHPPTAVLLNLRSYDTLLEMAVVLVAVLVVLAVTGPLPTVPYAVPSLQRSVTVLIAPVLVLLATWLLFAGSLRPGGAFQSGAVVAAAILLVHLGGHRGFGPGRGPLLLATMGLGGFVVVAALGPLLGGSWLGLDPAWAGVAILGLESLLAASIGASLALVAIALRGEGPP